MSQITVEDNTKYLSKRINDLAESATIAMAQKARELKEKGNDVISLSLGEPDFDTPVHIKDAAKKALDDGFTKYSPVPGFEDLRSAICEKLKRDNHLEYAPYNIVVSTGAKQVIANIFQCLLNPGDEVIVFTPYWVTYAATIELAGGVPVFVEGKMEDNFEPKIEEVQAAMTNKTRAIIYSSPCNPTGAIFSKEYLHSLSELLDNYGNVFVISDEIYEYINYSGEHFSIAQIDRMKNKTFLVNGFAKGYAMTGWRLGYLAAPQWFAKACGKFQGQTTSGTNSFAQKAAIQALLGDMGPTNTMLEAFTNRKALISKLLKEIEGVKVPDPDGAFYMFPDFSFYFGKKTTDGIVIKNALDLSMYILEKAHVSTVAGDAFGAPGFIRISYAASESQIETAIERIKSVLAELS